MTLKQFIQEKDHLLSVMIDGQFHAEEFHTFLKSVLQECAEKTWAEAAYAREITLQSYWKNPEGEQAFQKERRAWLGTPDVSGGIDHALNALPKTLEGLGTNKPFEDDPFDHEIGIHA